MEVQVNYLAILLAGVSSMVIGAIYYADAVCGKEWKRLSSVDTKAAEKRMPKILPWMFGASLLMAYIVAHVMYLSHEFYDYSWLSTGVMTALWLWLGIAATTIFLHAAPELKPGRLIWINVGYSLLSMLAMGLILGWLHP